MGQKELETKGTTAPGVNNTRKWRKAFIVNSTLLLSGIAVSVSGLMIQVHYHLLKSPGESTLLMMNRAEWDTVHTWTSVVFLFAAICHVQAHRKWYATVWKGRVLSKHRPTIVLTFLTVIVAVSGLIPLLIRFFNDDSGVRFSFIEIHDKIGILFFIVLFGHAIRRRGWYDHVLKRKFHKK